MTAIERTAYPRFKRNLTAKDLAEVYTPTPAERFLAARSTKGSVAEVGFLVLLKTYQRLGRFIPLSEVPVPILEHIARLIDPHLDVSDLDSYDSSGTRQRHIPLIRAAQQLKPYDSAARTCLLKAMIEAARTKEDLADLINVALEELAKECFELPPFATLDKAAHHVRAMTTRGLYRRISQAIPQEARAALDALFVVEDGARLSGWEQLKQEPASPTLTHLRDLIDHLFVISEQRKLLPPRLFEDLAEGKVKQLATEARADALVLTLRDLVTAYGKEGTSEERLAAMESVIGDRAAKILQDCEEHLAHVGNNYQPFLWSYYKGHRAQLFRLLSAMEFRSSSQDRSLEEAIVFLKAHEGCRGDWVITATVQNPGTPEEQRLPLVDLSWASDTWWKFMTGQSKRESCPDKVLRRHFEIAVFSQLLWDLKSGDLYVEGSDQYADYREQLIS